MNSVNPNSTTPRTVLGMSTVDFIDVIFKILGLITVIIAAADYLGKIEDRDNEQVRQHKADSTSNAKYKIEETQYMREQQRLDLQVAFQQKELINRQLDFQKDMNFRREVLERTLTNSFKQIYLQGEEKIKAERREYYNTTLTNSSVDMEILINTEPISDDYTKVKEDLFLKLYPKISNIGDNFLLKALHDFKRTLNVYLLVKPFIDMPDSVFFIADDLIEDAQKLPYGTEIYPTNNGLFMKYYKSSNSFSETLEELSVMGGNLPQELTETFFGELKALDSIRYEYKNLSSIMFKLDRFRVQIPSPAIYTTKLNYSRQLATQRLHFLLNFVRESLRKQKERYDILIHKKLSFLLSGSEPLY